MQRLPRFVELLLIVALCGVVALWATRVLRGAPIAIPPAADPSAASGNGRIDAMLASARLFGSRRPGVLSDNVRALGVIADAAGGGSVIVSVDGQPPKVYRVGDTLDGRRVSAIRSEEIELDAGGARQVFRLPPPRSTAGLTVLGTGPSTPGPNALPPMSVPPLQQQADPAPYPGGPPAQQSGERPAFVNPGAPPAGLR